MAGVSVTDISVGAAQTIGRYFSVISVIPSSLYVIFVYLLIASGSWTHPPDWSHAFTLIEHTDITGIAFLVFLSIALGIVIHPIQFAIVQFFEGYWGTSRAAQAVRTQRILRYQQLCERLEGKSNCANDQLNRWGKVGILTTPGIRAQLLSQYHEAERLRITAFPDAFDDIMPTRLGNVLRRAESKAGSQYGIDALQAVPHLLMIAPSDHASYVNDQRTLLDLAVRMTFISVIAAGTALLFLWPYGLWILIAALPYAMAYLSYRGAVVAAKHYGSAFDILINLDRFTLYKQLHLPIPGTTTEERKINMKLKNLLNYDIDEDVKYEHPADKGDSEEGNGETEG